MIIQKNFCDLPRFLKVNRGLSCRATCHYCKRKWNDTTTTHVSRLVIIENKAERVYYLCGDCVTKIEANGIDSLTSECK